MSYTIETDRFLNNLEQVARVRSQVAKSLGEIAQTLAQWEASVKDTSGSLGLERDIDDLSRASQTLQQTVFRILVLGDLKRGKSTLLNALIGENLLPADVNPCTALLTVLRYGTQKKVTVYFKGDNSSQSIDFVRFKQTYTIKPSEAKRREAENSLAFPDVSHAVVEYPLPLLEKGIEIVDTPGLNDTEARNELSLNYIHNCHAIMFVFRAMQPCTLEERRYLENYIKGRGLTVFFLINAWDEIGKGLINPDHLDELEQVQNRLRTVFKTYLADYCKNDGQDYYDQRVFEISSLPALRRRLKKPQDSLEGTGFPPFLRALNTFLTQERAVAQLRQVRTLVRQVYSRTHAAIERRIPLLDQDIEGLKQRIQGVDPEFEQLTQIRDQFREEIRTLRDTNVKEIVNSFQTYVLNLETTFESDFFPYQPTIDLLEFLQQQKREAFNAALKQALEQYLQDKLAAWERTAEDALKEAFSQLAQSAANYGATYNQVVDSMSNKLIGQTLPSRVPVDSGEESPTWTKWAMGFFSLASGNIASVALAAVGFNWQNILVNWLAVVLTPLGFWNPLGLVLLSLGVGAMQAEQGRQAVIKATKKQFVNYLPQLAQEQQEPIRKAVGDCFERYEQDVIQRINDDIQSHQIQLENLLQQKKGREINHQTELKRLRQLDSDILAQYWQIESLYEESGLIPG